MAERMASGGDDRVGRIKAGLWSTSAVVPASAPSRRRRHANPDAASGP